jgi:AbrB family looped-hinge helix DNA binding protein
LWKKAPEQNGIVHAILRTTTQAITVDRAGRILLPIEVRRHLNLVPGSRLTLDVVAQRIELTPEAQPEAELMLTVGGRAVLRPTGAAFDAAAATRAERDARAAQRMAERNVTEALLLQVIDEGSTVTATARTFGQGWMCRGETTTWSALYSCWKLRWLSRQ